MVRHPKMPVCWRHHVGSLQWRPAHWHVAYAWNERRHPRHHHSHLEETASRTDM